MASTVSSFLGKNSDCFAVFGVFTACLISLKLMSSIWSGVRAFVLGSGIDFKKLGEWAVVTGATDGIGKAYATELAKKGLNVVLVSRSMDKLRDVASELESKCKIKTKVIQADFTAGIEMYDRVREELHGLNIAVLVNNVGMSYQFPQFFCELSTDKQIFDMINVNMTSCTMMTKIILPGMVEKKAGAIINISSGSGDIPAPLLTQYSATKAYVDFFSRALNSEYKSKGIIVQSVLPFFVATKLSKIRNSSLVVPTPTSYVRSALNTVGVQDRTFGCLVHAVQSYLMSSLPESWLVSLSMKTLLPARSRGMKKQTKLQ